MTRKEAFEAVEEVLSSAMHDEKNEVLFQSKEWDYYKLHYDRARSCLGVIETEAFARSLSAFDFDVSIAELSDFIKRNKLQ